MDPIEKRLWRYVRVGFVVAAAIAALSIFVVAPPPADSGPRPTFELQGFKAMGDHVVVPRPVLVPGKNTGVLVSFMPPLSGACGLAQWSTVDGKTTEIMLDVETVKAGERAFLVGPIFEASDHVSGWEKADLTQARIVVSCADLDKGPDTLVTSQFYSASMATPQVGFVPD